MSSLLLSRTTNILGRLLRSRSDKVKVELGSYLPTGLTYCIWLFFQGLWSLPLHLHSHIYSFCRLIHSIQPNANRSAALQFLDLKYRTVLVIQIHSKCEVSLWS